MEDIEDPDDMVKRLELEDEQCIRDALRDALRALDGPGTREGRLRAAYGFMKAATAGLAAEMPIGER
jgi:hypothetical protein